jgi:hypothetical protein
VGRKRDRGKGARNLQRFGVILLDLQDSLAAAAWTKLIAR